MKFGLFGTNCRPKSFWLANKSPNTQNHVLPCKHDQISCQIKTYGFEKSIEFYLLNKIIQNLNLFSTRKHQKVDGIRPETKIKVNAWNDPFVTFYVERMHVAAYSVSILSMELHCLYTADARSSPACNRFYCCCDFVTNSFSVQESFFILQDYI